MNTDGELNRRALQLEIDRVTRRLRSSLNAMRAELDKVDNGISDHIATSRGRQVVNIAAEVAPDTARLDALHQYGNLTDEG